MLIDNSPLSSLYSSAKVLFWLTVFGAYGFFDGIFQAIKYIPRLWRTLQTKWRNRSTDTDYYYAYRESGYRVLQPAGNYWHVRKERIVALKPLSELPISYGWSGEGEITEEIVPDSYALVNLPKVIGHALVRKRIMLNPPLEKGQSAEYNFILRCKQTGRAPDPFLSSRSSHRVDVLLLRVVFAPSLNPQKVYYVKRNSDMAEVTKERLQDTDFLTGEYKKQIDYPEPNLYHRIEWE
jgi:hypothetical protein